MIYLWKEYSLQMKLIAGNNIRKRQRKDAKKARSVDDKSCYHLQDVPDLIEILNMTDKISSQYADF